MMGVIQQITNPITNTKMFRVITKTHLPLTQMKGVTLSTLIDSIFGSLV